MKKRFAAATMAALFAATALAGCGGGGSSASTAAPAGNNSTAAPAAESTAADNGGAAASTQASSADRTDVIVAVAQEPTGFFCQDSEISTNQAKDSPVLFNIYENLVWLDENGVCQPWLATDWTMAEDGLSYTFTIREGVTFSNGNPLTAEDVAFTCNLCKEKNPSLAGNLFINFDNAEVIDDTHVKFNLTAPFGGFVSELSARNSFIIDKEYYEEVGAQGYNDAPVGTGAYVMAERISGQEVRLEANPNWWGGDVKIKPIHIKPISNVATQFISLKTGDVDVINIADVASCKELTDADIATWFSQPSAARLTAQFNDAPGGTRLSNDKNFRLAVLHAINRDDILYACAEGEGYVMDCECPTGYNGYPGDGVVPVIDYDIAKAQELIGQSSYNNSQSMKIICIAGTAQETAANIIQGSLLQIGVNCEVSATDTGNYYAAMQAGDWDLNISVTSSSLNDVSSLNTQYKIQSATGAVHGENSDKLDEMCKQADVETDPEKRKAIWGEILTIAIEEGYGMGIYSANSVMALNKNLEGVTLNPNNAWRCSNWSWK